MTSGISHPRASDNARKSMTAAVNDSGEYVSRARTLRLQEAERQVRDQLALVALRRMATRTDRVVRLITVIATLAVVVSLIVLFAGLIVK